MPFFKISNYLFAIILIGSLSCSRNISDTLHRGKLPDMQFNASTLIEINTGLLIVPVMIKGKEYHFIFDTGAPTSISKEIQEELNFKVINKKHIVDSEGNKRKVEYVSVDSLYIANIPFIDQSAFVGDFSSNPVINCLKVDGIIGSNTMRFCNWEIDPFKEKITLFNTPYKKENEEVIGIPFRHDRQFDMIVNLKVGHLKLKNIKIDYGSNGSLSIPPSAFQALKEAGVIDQTFAVIGQTQTGFLGEIVEREYQISYLDSVELGDCLFKDVKTKSIGKGLFGNQLLSEYIVTIDWDKNMLYLKSSEPYNRTNATFGFGLGLNKKEDYIYVQSVIKESNAYAIGIRPMMRVAKIDSIDFLNGYDYCDYVNYINVNPDSTKLIMDDDQTFLLKKEVLYNK